jgi:hypothetical protein
VGQTQLGSFWSLITNQSNNTRENGKVHFVVDIWQLPSIDNKRYFPIFRVLFDWLVINDQKLPNWVWPTLYFKKQSRLHIPMVGLPLSLPPSLLREQNAIWSKSKQNLLYDWRSVDQYVLVSSPLWDLWPDITLFRKLAVWTLRSCYCGAPSLTRGKAIWVINNVIRPFPTQQLSDVMQLCGLRLTIHTFLSYPRNTPSSSVKDIFILICLKDSASLLFLPFFLSASRQTHTQGNNKINKGKQHMNKTQMETCRVWRKGRKKQQSRILQAYENKNILHTWRWSCRPKHVVKQWKPTQ